MPSEYFTAASVPPAGTFGKSSELRTEFTKVDAGFAKLPVLAGNPGKVVFVSALGNGLSATAELVVGSGEVVANRVRVTEAIPPGDASNRVCTTAFAASLGLSSALPGQTGKDGNVIKTRGGLAFWSKGELEIEIVTGTSVTAVNGKHYVLTNPAKTVVTAMASPSEGDSFRVSPANGRSDNEINWGGSKHNNRGPGAPDNVMTLSNANGSAAPVFVNASFGFKVTP